MKKVFIKTWGCQMNVYDSARMADVIRPLGFDSTDSVQDADLVIFNTCHIREKATEKLFSELGRLNETRKERATQGLETIIGIAGCVAQAEGEEIRRRAPFVDMIFGPQAYHQLPEMLARLARSKGQVLNTEFPDDPKFDFLPPPLNTTGTSAFVAIQEGCDKFCSYCVVPYTRGTEYSRPLASIVSEVQTLVAQGAREITLLGQNVNAYHGEGASGFGDLLRRLADLPDVKRLRYMTSHPGDVTDDQIAAHRDVPQVMPFLHLPVQSGSDQILDAMNRKHTADDYFRIIDRFRNAQPGIAFSSDFIVGFPGETDQDFDATMKLIRTVGFAQAYSFKYSRRHGTPAAAKTNQIPEALKDERLLALQDLIRTQQENFNHNTVGQKLSVLFEYEGRHKGQLRGRTPFMQSVHVAAPQSLIGHEALVTIVGVKPNSLMGELG